MARDTKWAVYFTWYDGTEDSIIADSTKDRDINIKDMISRGCFKYIAYCRIYANGEYGIDKVVLGKKGRC